MGFAITREERVIALPSYEDVANQSLGRATVVGERRQDERRGRAGAAHKAAHRYRRPGDAKLREGADGQAVERPHIAVDYIFRAGLDFGGFGRAIQPSAFAGAWIFLARSFFRPFERGLDRLTSIGPHR